jgi:hypothetical protein
MTQSSICAEIKNEIIHPQQEISQHITEIRASDDRLQQYRPALRSNLWKDAKAFKFCQ